MSDSVENTMPGNPDPDKKACPVLIKTGSLDKFRGHLLKVSNNSNGTRIAHRDTELINRF